MTSWMNRARCRTVGGPDLMNHDTPGTRAVALNEQAKRVCAACPVRQQCLDYALAMEGAYAVSFRGGIWGGTTPSERAAIARPSRAKGAAA
ncbi:WhiB family transcriptional regulator [Streptomyces sp. ME01-24h]|nr:WhiB family transcriptional regulator [Streptomyces sp. ME01-24h]